MGERLAQEPVAQGELVAWVGQPADRRWIGGFVGLVWKSEEELDGVSVGVSV